MEKINFNDFLNIFKDDAEFMEYFKNWNGPLENVYAKQLPDFEDFMFHLPDDMDIPGLVALLKSKPRDFRFLFAVRLNDFMVRLNSGYHPPVYKNVKDILIAEFYVNSPVRIHCYPC